MWEDNGIRHSKIVSSLDIYIIQHVSFYICVHRFVATMNLDQFHDFPDGIVCWALQRTFDPRHYLLYTHHITVHTQWSFAHQFSLLNILRVYNDYYFVSVFIGFDINMVKNKQRFYRIIHFHFVFIPYVSNPVANKGQCVIKTSHPCKETSDISLKHVFCLMSNGSDTRHTSYPWFVVFSYGSVPLDYPITR